MESKSENYPFLCFVGIFAPAMGLIVAYIISNFFILQYQSDNKGLQFCWVTGSMAQWQCAQLPQLIRKRFLEEQNFRLDGTSFSPTFLLEIFALREQSLDNTSICIQVYPWIITSCFSYCITRIGRAFIYFHVLVTQQHQQKSGSSYNVCKRLLTQW